MKKLVLLSAMAVLSLSATAQDDMYFVPTKKNVEKSAANYGIPQHTYYSGSRRSVDEYNRMAVRHGSSVQSIDSVGNDIVDFDAVSGVYPDSTAVNTHEDYQCTRRMSRFDDYDWWDGYYAGLSTNHWGYYDPWFSWGYYDPWYSWGWGYGWPYYYSSWYWDYPYWGGWYGPYYHGYAYYGGGNVGRPHVNRGFSSRDFRGTRGTSSAATGRFGSRSSFGNTRSGISRGSFSGSRGTSRGSFGSSRSTTRNYSSSPRYSSMPSSSFGSSSHSSGSFSGSRGGGFSGGSSRGGGGFSGGGGSHGGRR